MDLATALAYATHRQRGVLLTLKADGRPQASNIMYAVGDDGTIRISATADRAKSANAQRDPRVSLHVTADDFWSYAVIEGDVTLSAVASNPTAMVAERRAVVRISPTRAYGALR